jgi:hypothetical protein
MQRGFSFPTLRKLPFPRSEPHSEHADGFKISKTTMSSPFSSHFRPFVTPMKSTSDRARHPSTSYNKDPKNE